jgi:hypothetical protein
MSRTYNEFKFAADRIPTVHFTEYLRSIHESDDSDPFDERYDNEDAEADFGLIGHGFFERAKIRRIAKKLR